MGVSPCTVTQWRNRGYLQPVEGSPPRKPLYRMRDVEDAEHQARLNAIRTSGSDRKVRRQRGGGLRAPSPEAERVSMIKRWRRGQASEMIHVPIPEEDEPLHLPAGALREITAAAMPALARHGSVTLALSAPSRGDGLPGLDAAAAAYYVNPQHHAPAGPPRRRREQRLGAMIPVRFPAAIADAVTDRALEEGSTVSAWIRRAVYQALAQPERPSGPVEGSGKAGSPRALPSSLAGTFTCPHMAVGNVTSASCGICGPLRTAS